MTHPYSPGVAEARLTDGARRPLAAWLVAGALALVLAGCGGSDSDTESAQSGTLLVANGDTTLAACDIDDAGTVRTCQRVFPAGVQVSGNVAVQSGYAYVTDLLSHNLAVCKRGAGGALGDCVTHAAQGLLTSPAGLATTENALFVANDDGGLVGCVLTAPGQVGACRDATPDGTFANPMDLAVHAGRLYVSVQGSNRIDHCAIGTGATLSDCRADSGQGFLNRPTGLAASDGRLFITNPDTDTLVNCGFGDGGRLRDCHATTEPEHLEKPLDIAANGDMLYVANPGLQGITACRVATDGKIRSCEALVAGGAFFLPTGIAFVPAAR